MSKYTDYLLKQPDSLSKLLRICYIIGYGDGKISYTHISDTPTKNKLIKERRRLCRKYMEVIREYQPTW